jgi:hypothetical protein
MAVFESLASTLWLTIAYMPSPIPTKGRTALVVR